jgi:hypothetical protein
LQGMRPLAKDLVEGPDPTASIDDRSLIIEHVARVRQSTVMSMHSEPMRYRLPALQTNNMMSFLGPTPTFRNVCYVAAFGT